MVDVSNIERDNASERQGGTENQQIWATCDKLSSSTQNLNFLRLDL